VLSAENDGFNKSQQWDVIGKCVIQSLFKIVMEKFWNEMQNLFI
jgi:hypothetical protein